MPVRRPSRQPRGLQRQHQADLPETDVGDQLLEPEAAVTRRARPAEVPVHHHHLLGRPAQLDRALAQRILARRGLHVALHLSRRRRAHTPPPPPPAMRRGDLAASHRARPPPPGPAPARAAPSPRAGPRPATPPTPPPPPVAA